MVKEDIVEDPSRPVKRSYDAVVGLVSRRRNFSIRDIPQFTSIRSGLQRTRQELLPPVPRNVDDVQIRGTWRKTWGDEDFLLEKNNNRGFIVFATRENMKVLQRCKYVFIDGTFKTAPRPYYQHVTIHGRYQNRVIHLASCLMTGKTLEQYREVLKAIKRGVRHASGRRLKPRFVVCDFELSIIRAVETELHGAKVCGCVFHFRQSIFRKVVNLGLKRAYVRDNDVTRVIQKCMSLCFLPMPLVRVNYMQMVGSARVNALINNYPSLRDFLEYIRLTYFDGNLRPSIWNCYNRRSIARTNNFVESK